MRRSAISYNRGFPNPMHDSDCDGASTRPATRYDRTGADVAARRWPCGGARC
ncbi:hypothetical protein V6Z11_D03G191600 [Gossypium hirsutum]